MWRFFLVVLVLVALCFLGLGINVLFFRKEFPAYDVGSNEELLRRGIRCFKDEDADLHRRACTAERTEACRDCRLYNPKTESFRT